jgi:fatty-acyl-CoA synthase
MTEAAGVISVDPTCGERTLSSVGYRIPYTEIAIRRLNSDGTLGEVCAPNEVGVLTVKGPTVSPGYKDQAQNAGVFDGATLNTGDLAFVDELGKLHIAGRAKDLIIRGGHNIDPMMIEEVMTSHPAVALAAAVSQPDAYAGELPVCYLSLRPDMQVTLDVLMEHARAAIAERPAWPKHLYIVDALPMTNVGKIYKPALRLDATKRLVQALLSEHGIEEASVSVVDGGPRGQRVTVTLAASTPQRAAEKARDLLAPYVFESVVAVGA